MTWVITRLCRDCLDTSCVDACPVDCIYEYVGPSDDRFPNQLYIDPEECIDCQACEPVCPWEAPLRNRDVPVAFEDDVALNALVLEHKELFVVPPHTDKPQPTPADVAANQRKWSCGAPLRRLSAIVEATRADRRHLRPAGSRHHRHLVDAADWWAS